MIRRVGIFFLLLCCMPAAHAANDALSRPSGSAYVGYSAGFAMLSPDTQGSASRGKSDTDIAQRVLAGYQFSPRWRAEWQWADLGGSSLVASNGAVLGTVAYQAMAMTAVYQRELYPDLDGQLRAGVVALQRDYQYLPGVGDDTDTGLLFGAGVSWRPLLTWDVRLDLDVYSSEVQLLSLGVVKHLFWGARREAVQEVARQRVLASDVAMVTVKPTRPCEDFYVHYNSVAFARGSIDVDGEARAELDRLAQQLKALPRDIQIEVRAHADDVGTETYNYTLSLMRARAVRDYLGERGVALGRINADGYGEWKAGSGGTLTLDKSQLRRAELVLLGIEKYLAEDAECGPWVTPW